jgi:chemotaxis protein MotB
MDEESEEHGAHDSSERWLISYADFMTLLFALFVVLYALSVQSSDQVNRAWQAMATSVGVRPHRGGLRPELGESGHGADVAGMIARRQLNATMANLAHLLQKFQDAGITLKIDNRGLVISLSAARFFPSGEAEITPTQLPVLEVVTRTLSNMPNQMEIDGFTDSVPIHNSRFNDNWELSSARAASVLRYLLAHSPLDPSHMTIAGYGPYGAIADNATDQGRSQPPGRDCREAVYSQCQPLTRSSLRLPRWISSATQRVSAVGRGCRSFRRSDGAPFGSCISNSP